MSNIHNFSYGPFEWFLGVVEDRNDPDKLGRVRVRVFGYYGDDIPVSDLPWATVMQGVDSAAQKGIGTSPTGMQVGTHVVGFFADGVNAQTPVVMGTLAGKPGGKPDTNALARGEDIAETVIMKKKKSIKISNAVAGPLSKLNELQGKISSTIGGMKDQVNGLRSQFEGLTNLPVMGQLNKISGMVSQIAAVPTQAQALKDQLEGEVRAVKGQVEYLKNLDPEAMAKQFAKDQVGDVQGAVRAIKSLNFDNAMNSLNSIPSAIGQLDRLQGAVSKLSNISGLISQVKGLSRAIPNIAAVRALGTTLASANTWIEPFTPAAPAYPLNKIKETEGGHIEEYDDTPGSERYHRYHPAGSFTEVHPDGTTVDKVVKDNYRLVMGDDFLHVEGKVQINILGDASVVVNGNCTTQVSGNKMDVVNGNYSIAVGGDYSVASGGSSTHSAATQYAVRALRIDLN